MGLLTAPSTFQTGDYKKQPTIQVTVLNEGEIFRKGKSMVIYFCLCHQWLCAEFGQWVGLHVCVCVCVCVCVA